MNAISEKYNALGAGFRQFLWKTGIFIAVFIALSLLIGQAIVSSKLLYGFDIFIYGGMGYILLFTIFGFVLLYRKRLLELDKEDYKPVDFVFLVISAMALVIFFVIYVNLSNIADGALNIIEIHMVFLSIFGFLLLGIYGVSFVIKFLTKFKKELFYFIIFGIATYSLMYYVWGLWPYFSWVVIRAVYYMLSLISSNVKVIQPRTLIFEGFGAQIAEACSGVYSIFLFSALYLFIIFIDWKKIYKTRALILFVPAVAGAFLVNIIRVFGLFVVGAYFSREVALGMYHSYTGMILFLIYFAIFWASAYRWITREKLSTEKVRKLVRKARADTLFMNSIYLMIGTIIMSVCGFAFWMIAARLFSAEKVGLATTIISIMGIIINLSGLGVGASIIRFLPKSKRKNDKINTAFTIVALSTIIITAIFIAGIDVFSPKLHFIKADLLPAAIFIVFMIFAAWAALMDSIFIAYREAKYTLIKNSIFAVLRIGLIFFFVSFGAYGIFASWMISVIIGFLTVLAVLIAKYGYRPKAVFYHSIAKTTGKYSAGSYLAGSALGTPALIIPILLTDFVGAKVTAYYYIAMMIAAMLFTIPQATANSLFAEGSYNEKTLGKQARKAAIIIASLLIPAILIVVFFGNYILLFFGKQYSAEGFAFLQILAISGIFVAINSVYATVFRVQKKIKSLVIISAFTSAVILILSILLIHKGLVGIGVAWIIGNFVSVPLYAYARKRHLKNESMMKRG